jgi:1,4-dihydroxy-2-naphthoate octaprenyltransferase
MQHLSAFPTKADRRIALALAAIAVVVLVAIIYLIWRSPAPPALRLFLGAVIMLIAWTVGSMPFSYNELTREGILLRQGWYFRAFIPYSNIDAVTIPAIPTGLWPPGVRRESDGKGLRVVLSRQNLITLELKKPQRFLFLDAVPLVTAERVVLNVPNPEVTVRSIESRIRAN